MPGYSALATLACGKKTKTTSDLSDCLRQIYSTMLRVQKHLFFPDGRRKRSKIELDPFLIRSIIELTCTALIARFDPFRVLVLKKVQENLNPSLRNMSAISWQGDVLSEPVRELWDQNKSVEKMPRSLLGDYYNAIFWIPAFQKFLDFIQKKSEKKEWTLRLSSLDPKRSLPSLRTRATQSYTHASKGVHHELVIRPSLLFSDQDLQTLLDDTMYVCATLSIVANFSDLIPFKLDDNSSFRLYESLQS